MSYLQNAFYLRDPKQFMQGYNAAVREMHARDNPYHSGGDWFESWSEGHKVARYYQSHADDFSTVRELSPEIQRRKDKQARNALNRKVRGDTDRQMDMKKAK